MRCCWDQECWKTQKFNLLCKASWRIFIFSLHFLYFKVNKVHGDKLSLGPLKLKKETDVTRRSSKIQNKSVCFFVSFDVERRNLICTCCTVRSRRRRPCFASGSGTIKHSPRSRLEIYGVFLGTEEGDAQQGGEPGELVKPKGGRVPAPRTGIGHFLSIWKFETEPSRDAHTECHLYSSFDRRSARERELRKRSSDYRARQCALQASRNLSPWLAPYMRCPGPVWLAARPVRLVSVLTDASPRFAADAGGGFRTSVARGGARIQAPASRLSTPSRSQSAACR